MTIQLPIDPDKLARFCIQHQFPRLSLFGSMLTGSERPDSDIDLLVEFEPGREPGLLGMGQIEAELGSLLGQRVDHPYKTEMNQNFNSYEKCYRSNSFQ